MEPFRCSLSLPTLFPQDKIFNERQNVEKIRVLGIDTTAEYGSVALIEKERVVASATFEGGRKHSVQLFGAVESLLKNVNRALGDMDVFAVATGPGSFTGIRVGLAAVKGWAEALRKPVVGVSVLDAIAASCKPSTPWIVSVLNAQRGEFYAAFYNSPSAKDDYQLIGEPHLLKASEFQRTLQEKLLPEAAATLLTRGSQNMAPALRALGCGQYPLREVARPLAEVIGEMALRRKERNRDAPPGELAAFYLRRPDAEIHWKD